MERYRREGKSGKETECWKFTYGWQTSPFTTQSILRAETIMRSLIASANVYSNQRKPQNMQTGQIPSNGDYIQGAYNENSCPLQVWYPRYCQLYYSCDVPLPGVSIQIGR